MAKKQKAKKMTFEQWQQLPARPKEPEKPARPERKTLAEWNRAAREGEFGPEEWSLIRRMPRTKKGKVA